MAAVQSPPPAPQETSSVQYESLTKLQSVPIVQDSIAFAHSQLSTNAYTAYVYNTSLGLSAQAYRQFGKPVEARLQPYIQRADGLALSGINAVEQRIPYPFQTPTDKMIGDVKSSSDQAYQAFYTRVGKPATDIATSADRSLSPIVDKLELAVGKIGVQEDATAAAPAAAGSQEAQYKRAYRLSLKAKDQVLLLSNEQLKQLQQHNSVVQKASESVTTLTAKLDAFGKDANARVGSVSNDIVAEIKKIQASAASLPHFLQSSAKPLQDQLSSSLAGLQSTIKAAQADSKAPASERAKSVVVAVQKEVGPVLDALKATYANLVSGAKGAGEEVKEKAPVA